MLNSSSSRCGGRSFYTNVLFTGERPRTGEEPQTVLHRMGITGARLAVVSRSILASIGGGAKNASARFVPGAAMIVRARLSALEFELFGIGSISLSSLQEVRQGGYSADSTR
jgi:hypothetical protein